MAKLLDKQRYKCALGAMQSVQAIDRALPILHSGPGCAQKLSESTGSSGYFSPNIFPCTSINEKDVVFGGVKKLNSTIENALKVIDADLYVVLTGCIPEIVGDDSGEVVSRFEDADKPVLYAPTAGFKGNNFKGHEQVVDAIIDQLLEKSEEKEKGLVNIWADVPYQDLFWLGNLRELENLIKEIGLTPNTIFGYKRGIENIKKIPKAEFNLLISPWVGLSNVKKMERKFGIPFLHYKTLPIGATETSKFLREVGKFAGVDEKKVEDVITEHEDYYYYLIGRYADLFLENRVINKQFTVVGDAHYTLGITKFLANDLGLIPAKQFVVDDTPKKYRDDIAAEFKNLNFNLEAEVSFETDGYKIHNEIKEHDYHGYPLILGGYYEKEITEELKGNFINISWPVQDKVVLDNSYVGYTGGIRLIEDIYTVAVSRFN
ncbi:MULTISPECIES: nitrogenase component 1 [Eubacterium]|uniref:Nitrogenase molybdenum-iron protein beta chain n=1 Tax=Eubacterium uniforme TaxID=39495 RepID=A0A1T4VJU3_9FIRM|nr:MULTISPECIES: nitrogenase component 1 [Eubacterium]MCR5629419.1 hydrogenase [Eubacterium sp.]SKA65232.1 nitrogenase molybdenum-iron protein beta chain [Eubacterium uniforme]HAH18180.1 hydrogenase [Eubacterium sp.]